MKKLSKKQLRKALAVAATSTALVGVGTGITYQISNRPVTQTQAATVNAKVKYVDDATFKKGSDIVFDIYSQVPYTKNMTRLMLYDKLEPVFTHTKTRIFDGSTDITDQGTLDFDKKTNTTNWIAKEPSKWFGKKLTQRVEVNLQDNADLSKYLDKNTNQYNIPNQGDLVVNDDTTPSNIVHVHTPNDKEPTVYKTVVDKNNKEGKEAKYQQGDEFHYHVTYNIPKNGKDLTNVEFSDDLKDVLDLKNVKIIDDKGNDITKQEGNLNLDNDKESFVWQPNKDYLTKMADHSYKVDITAQVKPNADLSKYLDKASQEYRVPNTAHMKYNDKDIPSNHVEIVTPPPTDNKVIKSVKGLSDSYKQDTDNVEVGKPYTYKVEYDVASGKTLKDVEFSDDLEDVLDLKKVEIHNSNDKDITDSAGTLKVDNDKESFVWQPKDDFVKGMNGQKYTAYITVQVKPDADLQKYIKNNQIQIPNTAHMKSNGEDTPSNTPVVTPKVDEPKAKKGIVKNPSDWTKFFGNQASTAAGQESDDGQSKVASEWRDAEKYVKKDSSGNYVKVNSKVTDEQYKKAVAALDKVAPITTNSSQIQTEGVKTENTTTPTNSNDLKQLINASTVENNEAARGDALDYLLTFEIGNQDNMKSLVLSDNLEDVLDLKNVVIIDSDGKNITNDGSLTISQNDESFVWSAKDPAKYSGKTIYVAVASNIKKHANLSDYDGKAIPNTGHLIINGKDTPTNKVKTKLNGTPDPNSPDNPDNPKSPLHGDGTNNPITGKNGVLPQTGNFILKHAWGLISALVVALGGVLTFAYKKKTFPFNFKKSKK